MNGNERPLVCAIRGPITLITLGVLFALNNFTTYGFGKTWPVLLIVFGLLSLLRRGTERRAAEAGVPGFPPYGYPPPANPPGSYQQGPYSGSPSFTQPGPAKGGFGTSAPPRPPDSGQTPPSGDAL